MEIVLKEGYDICYHYYGNTNDIMLQIKLLFGQLYENQLNQFDKALHHYMNWINLFECPEGNSTTGCYVAWTNGWSFKISCS